MGLKVQMNLARQLLYKIILYTKYKHIHTHIINLQLYLKFKKINSKFIKIKSNLKMGKKLPKQ